MSDDEPEREVPAEVAAEALPRRRRPGQREAA
jgi:hypothetical protein